MFAVWDVIIGCSLCEYVVLGLGTVNAADTNVSTTFYVMDRRSLCHSICHFP